MARRRPSIEAELVQNRRRERGPAADVGLLVIPAPIRRRVILSLRESAGETAALHLDSEAAMVLVSQIRQALAEIDATGPGEYVAQGHTVFHRRSCEHLNPLNVARYFLGREDALRDGFRPCRTCFP